MSILPVMILVSMLVVVIAGIAFFWAVEHDQFEDLQSPGFLPLIDDPVDDDESPPRARDAGSARGDEPGDRGPPAVR
jgi:cbb3-type cytochrome oxidase maturation protein